MFSQEQPQQITRLKQILAISHEEYSTLEVSQFIQILRVFLAEIQLPTEMSEETRLEIERNAITEVRTGVVIKTQIDPNYNQREQTNKQLTLIVKNIIEQNPTINGLMGKINLIMIRNQTTTTLNSPLLNSIIKKLEN